MRDLRRRLRKLETIQRRRRPAPHFLSVLRWPASIEHAEVMAWLREEVRCPCGTVGCPELRVGLLAPEIIEDPEEWSRHYQAEAAKTPEQRQVERDAWYALHTGVWKDSRDGAA